MQSVLQAQKRTELAMAAHSNESASSMELDEPAEPVTPAVKRRRCADIQCALVLSSDRLCKAQGPKATCCQCWDHARRLLICVPAARLTAMKH